MPSPVYTPATLMHIGKNVLNDRLLSRVTTSLWNRLKDLNICKTLNTRRGCFAGRQKQRRIPTRITPQHLLNSCETANQISRVTYGNLIQIPITKHSQGRTDFLQINNQYRRNTLRCSFMNCRSLCNKSTAINEFLQDRRLDVLMLAETWLHDDESDSSLITESLPPGYSIISVPRKGRGGGIATIFNSSLSVSQHPVPASIKSIELMEVRIKTPSSHITLATVYRPPPKNSNGFTVDDFVNDFTNFLSGHLTNNSPLVIAGDFNFHTDNPNCPNARKYRDILESFSMRQLITSATHRAGHTIDHIITRADDNTIADVRVEPIYAISDHFPLLFSINNFSRVGNTRKSVISRNMKAFSATDFAADLSTSIHLQSDADISANCELIYNTVRDTFDRHAPTRERLVPNRRPVPWINQSIIDARLKRMKAERDWRKSRLEVHRQIYRACRTDVVRLVESAKKSHYAGLVDDSAGNQKQLFQIVKGLLGHNNTSTVLPKHDDPLELANRFANFFINRVKLLTLNLGTVSGNSNHHLSQPVTELKSECRLDAFTPTTVDEIDEIIRTSPSSTCCLDPIPTKIFKHPDITQVLLPHITEMFNHSLRYGVVPTQFKEAVVKPLIKKPSLDHEVLKNFRPVSNLPFLSKILERIVAKRLTSHIVNNSLDEPLQSAYKPGHSIETALLKVQNDILLSLDEKKDVFLVLLDLSAAFDTVNHTILLNRLRDRFGLSDNVLMWFQSYLSNRSQCVLVNSTKSPFYPLDTGVPQGSVLGPILFNMYTSPLGELVASHGCLYSFYADDSSLYLSFTKDTAARMVSNLELCISDVRSWMSENFLCLNDDKTEFVIFSASSGDLSAGGITEIRVGDALIPVHCQAKSLGAILDSCLTMKPHIGQICRSAIFHLRRIALVRKYLSQHATEQLVHAFITSRIDSCNSLLLGLPKHQINRIQRVQNIAARIVTRSKITFHITPILYKLHWLPVSERIVFKILVLIFKSIHRLGPIYLSEMTKLYVPNRNLRSADQFKLCPVRSRTKNYGDRAFSVAAPTLWNNLPINIRQSPNLSAFKSNVKTFLFKSAFN